MMTVKRREQNLKNFLLSGLGGLLSGLVGLVGLVGLGGLGRAHGPNGFGRIARLRLALDDSTLLQGHGDSVQ